MFPERIHRYIFLFGLLSLGYGVMMGAVPTSVPQFILMGNWIAEGKFRNKLIQLKSSRVFWVLIAVMLAHVLGLLYSSNIEEGLKDLKIKVPLVLLPIVLFSTPVISKKEFHALLYCFIVGCITNTGWCLLYSFVLHHNDATRDASRFMSHIRLGLYLNMAIAVCTYFIFTSEVLLKKSLWALLIFYFVSVLLALGLASGLFNFIVLLFLAVCVFIYRQKIVLKIAALLCFLICIALVIRYVDQIKDSQLEVREAQSNIPQKFAPSGRPYLHFDVGGQKENGNYIQINVQPEELWRAWKTEFPEDSFNYEQRYHLDRFAVLIRYMASKGLNKDSATYRQLTAGDKANIRSNITNYEYPAWSYLHKRIYELVNEYDEFMHHRFVNGHSLTMRLYFWKAALHLVEQNMLFGVGTGDVQEELNKTYVETKSPLDQEWFKRPHNQFLTITVALGLAGLLIFLFSILYPAVKLKGGLPPLYWPFFIITFLSFFMEDTLETQAGCTFYAFFNTVLIWLGPRTERPDRLSQFS